MSREDWDKLRLPAYWEVWSKEQREDEEGNPGIPYLDANGEVKEG